MDSDLAFWLGTLAHCLKWRTPVTRDDRNRCFWVLSEEPHYLERVTDADIDVWDRGDMPRVEWP